MSMCEVAIKNYMEFDNYLYIVTAYDNDGTEREYEYGNIDHAMEHYKAEKQAKLYRYKDGEKELIPVEKD
jgi:hypothetical protein